MIELERYEGTDNRFAVVEASSEISERGAFAEWLCNRDERASPDGVLFLDLEERSVPSTVTMELVQADRSEPAMCGNGARCAARWAANRSTSTEFVLETGAGPRHATVDGEAIHVEMGIPSFEPGAIPLGDSVEGPLIDTEIEGLSVSAVTTGVPHAVSFVDDADDVDLEAVAPPVRHADVFPEGANVTLASPTETGFDQRTFERGVEGETQACGTGAVAIGALARKLERFDVGETVELSPPGGVLRVSFESSGRATLVGPARRTGTETIADEQLQQLEQ